MLDNMLYVVNFEPYEPELIECLTRLREVGCRHLTLAHIPRTEDVLQHVPRLLQDEMRRCLQDVAWSTMQTWVQRCVQAGMPARAMLKQGELAWLEIRQLVQQERIDLVVLGPTVGPHLSPTVNFLMPGARTPLLIVKVPPRVEQAPYDTICQSLFGRVLYPTDGSPCARRALDSIIQLKPLGIQDVVLVHVIEPAALAGLSGTAAAAYRAEMQALLAHSQAELEGAGLRVEPILLDGQPERELVALSVQRQIALIVMGSTGKGKAAEMSLGSVSAYVARTTDRSVLLIY